MPAKKILTSRPVLWLLVLGQLVAVLLIALGAWPDWVSWINLAASALFIIFSPVEEGLLLMIASIPFFVVLPNRFAPSLPTWRILFVVLFLRWLAQLVFRQRDYWHGLWREQKLLRTSRQQLWELVSDRLASRLMSWDKYAVLVFAIMLVSLGFAKFPGQALRQIAFLFNAYLLYLVVINAVTAKEQVVRVLRYAAISSGIIVALGYLQLLISLFVPPFEFWQFWAYRIAALYYGVPLANVLSYSNSWFSYTSGGADLRVFSIMPDSHSFAMVAVFCILFCLPLLAWFEQPKLKKFYQNFATKNYYLWYVIRFAGLAVILSGTRGVWVGMIAPLILSVGLYVKKFGRPMVKKQLITYALIILFFILAPFINEGLHIIEVNRFEENFLTRARSIYDLGEESNVGRLIIWRDSLNYATIHPFGIGYGNFVVSLVKDIPLGASYDQAADQKNLRYNLPQRFVTAHSLYLQLLVELGLAGLLVFILFWWEYFTEWWKFFRKYREQQNVFTLFVVSAGFGYLWFLAYSIFDVTWLNDKVLMYFFLSMGLSGLIMRNYATRYNHPTDL